MATLEKIRNKSVLLISFIGIALIAFIVGDFLNSGQTFFQMNANKVAVVDGTRIEIEEYQNRVTARTEEMQEMFRRQYGMAMPDGYASRINQEVFDQMVSEILMNNQLEKLGLAVTPAELYDLIEGENIAPAIRQSFSNPNTGEFDRAALQQFLQNVVKGDASMYGAEMAQQVRQQKSQWLALEKSIQSQRASEKFATLFMKSIVPNALDAEAGFEADALRADFAYTLKPYSSVPDSSVQVTSEEVKSLYNSRKAQYTQDEQRVVRYITVDLKPSEKDFKLAEEKINNHKEAFTTTTDMGSMLNYSTTDVPYTDYYQRVSNMTPDMKNFVETSELDDTFGPFFESNAYHMYRLMGKTVAPDSVKLRHILVDAANTALVDSLVEVLNKKGDFTALAQEFSLDQQTGANGGEWGWITEANATQLGKELIEASFAAKGENTFVAQTQYGTHILQVMERTANVDKAKVAQMVVNVNYSSETSGNLYGELNAYITTNSSLSKFVAPEEASYVVSTATLTPSTYNLGSVVDARESIRWAYNNSKGDISDIFTAGDKLYVVAVEDVVPAGTTPLSQLEPALRAELLKKKKGEKIIADLAAQNLTSLDAYATAMTASVDTARLVSFATSRISGLGSEPVLAGLAPYAPVGAVSAPIAGNMGVFVFSTLDVVANDEVINVADEKATYVQAVNEKVSRQMLQALQDKAVIEDTRIKFF